MGSMRKWARSVGVLAKEIGITRQRMYDWLKRDGCPGRTGRGWNVGKVMDFIINSRKTRERGGAPAKDRKLELECEVLEMKRDRLRGTAVPVREVRDMFAEYATVVNGVFDEWMEWVEATTRDTKILAKARTCSDRARRAMASKLQALGEKEDAGGDPELPLEDVDATQGEVSDT
jgi:hypothetical protein